MIGILSLVMLWASFWCSFITCLLTKERERVPGSTPAGGVHRAIYSSINVTPPPQDYGVATTGVKQVSSFSSSKEQSKKKEPKSRAPSEVSETWSGCTGRPEVTWERSDRRGGCTPERSNIGSVETSTAVTAEVSATTRPQVGTVACCFLLPLRFCNTFGNHSTKPRQYLLQCLGVPEGIKINQQPHEVREVGRTVLT